MTTIPNWWLIATGTATILVLLLFVVLIVLVFQLIKQVQILTPKVNDTLNQLQQVTAKVDALAVSVKDTMDTVGPKAKKVATSVETVAELVALQAVNFSPILKYGLMAFKAFQMFRGSKSKPKFGFKNKSLP